MSNEYRTNELKQSDDRFDALLAEADRGDETAVHSLWAEYGYYYEAGGFEETFSEMVDRMLAQVAGLTTAGGAA